MNMGIIAASRLRSSLEPNINLFGNLSGNNKWFGGVLAPNGKIYGMPRDSNQILEISQINIPDFIGSDADIPSSLLNLATSNYNQYYNKL